MDRQDFHTHCSYVRARRSPYLRQQIFAGGEHILHIPWRVCQGTALSWHAVPASEALREPSGREGVPGGCQLQARQESYPTSRCWDEHGWAREEQTPRNTELLLWAELPASATELWAHAVLPQGCRALVRDMGKLPLPAFEFQVEILLFVWNKKSCKLFCTCLLSAHGLLGGLQTLCDSVLLASAAAPAPLPAASPLSSLLCCSWVPLPAQGRPPPPEVLFRARGGQKKSWDFFWFFFFLMVSGLGVFFQSHRRPWDNVGQWQGKAGDIIGVAALCASGSHAARSTARFIFGRVAWGESYTLWI